MQSTVTTEFKTHLYSQKRDRHRLATTLYFLYLTVLFTDVHCISLYPTVHFFFPAMYPAVCKKAGTDQHGNPLYSPVHSTD